MDFVQVPAFPSNPNEKSVTLSSSFSAMDPNPKSFPVLSYVMYQMGQISADDSVPANFDIEQPNPGPIPSKEGEIFEQMPHLNHPHLLNSMAAAVSDVAHTRSILQILGPRPDHESVDVARAALADIESRLSNQLEEIALDQRPEGVVQQAEREREKAAEEEKSAYKAVVQLDELHEAYEKLLRDAEQRLVKIYDSAEEAGPDYVPAKDVEMNEEVVGILRQASDGLERVELMGRELPFLPEEFGRLHGLVVLNLSENQLEVIPDSIAGLGNLQELHLSSNLLVSLPDSIGLLLNLKILDVSGNKLTALPNSISHCRSLVELDASFNGLTYLPTDIGHELVKLQKLLVHLNKIRSLPTSICEMRSLCHLDAHFNELCGLPHRIGRLTNLEILNLSSNFSDLTELPDTVGDLSNLRELDLSNNQIHSLPVTFGQLYKLTKLNLEQNPLVIPPAEIVNRGVEAVKVYMTNMSLDILMEEERSSVLKVNEHSQAGWLTRSTSWLNNRVVGVSESVKGYMGTGEKSQRDPCLDQQL